MDTGTCKKDITIESCCSTVRNDERRTESICEQGSKLLIEPCLKRRRHNVLSDYHGGKKTTDQSILSSSKNDGHLGEIGRTIREEINMAQGYALNEDDRRA